MKHTPEERKQRAHQRRLRRDIEKQEARIELLKDLLGDLENELLKLQNEACGAEAEGWSEDRKSMLHHSEYHECDKSPTGRCVYAIDQDPSWDFCLYCGDPHERK